MYPTFPTRTGPGGSVGKVGEPQPPPGPLGRSPADEPTVPSIVTSIPQFGPRGNHSQRHPRAMTSGADEPHSHGAGPSHPEARRARSSRPTVAAAPREGWRRRVLPGLPRRDPRYGYLARPGHSSCVPTPSDGRSFRALRPRDAVTATSRSQEIVRPSGGRASASGNLRRHERL